MIKVDFNARTEDGLVRLDTKGAKATLPKSAKAGDVVWLEDDEMEVEALLEERDGKLLARPRWGSLLRKD